MKLLLILFLIILIICNSADIESGDKRDDPWDIGLNGDLSVTDSVSRGFAEMFRDIMEDLSHITSLHESVVHHPIFSLRSHIDDDKPISAWESSLRLIKRWSPKYEIINDSKSFQVKIDLPGFHFHEINVELEAGGRLLSISGRKENDVRESSTHEQDHETKATTFDEKDMVRGVDETKFDFTSHA